MRKILVALDFSDVSDAVLARASALTRALSGELTLLHVAAPDPDFVGYDAGPQSVRDGRARELRAERSRLHEMAESLRAEGLSARALLVEGPTARTVLEQAEKLTVDLIVVGSHGHGVLHRALLGSVSEGILERATCPVLVVPVHAT